MCNFKDVFELIILCHVDSCLRHISSLRLVLDRENSIAYRGHCAFLHFQEILVALALFNVFFLSFLIPN